MTHKPMCRRGYKTSDCSRGEARRNRMLLGHSTKPGSHRSIAVLASCTSSVPRCSDDSTRAATAEPRKIISPVANSSSTIARVSSMAPSQSPVRAFSFKFDVDHLARDHHKRACDAASRALASSKPSSLLARLLHEYQAVYGTRAPQRDVFAEPVRVRVRQNSALAFNSVPHVVHATPAAVMSLGSAYLIPTTIESGPTRCST